MKLEAFDDYCRNVLDFDAFACIDPSLNGIQMGDASTDIHKVAFAVDACQATIDRALDQNAQLLFVHHGLFWGKPLPIVGTHFQRVKRCITGGLALYAVHLPLDAHEVYGNNAGLFERLGATNKKPFGFWKNIPLGFSGTVPYLRMEAVIQRLCPQGEMPTQVLPFGKEKICSFGVVSGGGAHQIDEAIEKKLDLFITGEIGHATYHTALEHQISVIALGHYQSETVGLQLLAKKIETDLELETIFISVPTGM